MPDYAANSNKSKKKEQKAEQPSKPEVVKVISGEAKIRKKGLGEKFKSFFADADARSVTHYVMAEVVLPAARDLFVDAARKGIERAVYGEGAVRRQNISGGGGLMSSRSFNTNYNSMSNQRRGKPMRAPSSPNYPPDAHSNPQNEILLPTRGDAEQVLDAMNEILSQGYFVTVGDFKGLCGYPSEHTDERYGWESLRGTIIKQTREGYLLDLPAVVSN